MTGYRKQLGVTLIELLIAVALGALIIAGMSAVMGELAQTQAAIQERNRLTENGRFAMDRMVRTLSYSRRLLLPLADNPDSNWREDVREQTVPPSPPEGDSTLATAVLAVTLPEHLDLNADGIPDADEDGDGRIDEDAPGDNTWDNAPGIVLIDDDGDGSVDEGSFANNDDDEALSTSDEDPVNGIDDDGDGNIDEDSGADMNGDGCPGICGVDDDEDGLVDEGSVSDDDEDGRSDEDYYGTVVFYLDSGLLKERMHVPWDISGGGLISGLDYVTSDIASNVTRLRFERLPPAGGGSQVVDITLELTDPENGETVSLHTPIRIGSAL